MAEKSNIQVVNEKARAFYEAQGQPPLLSQICAMHNISVRDFAAIFEISKSQAQMIIAHKTFPSLELAVRIARYWECTVEEIFGWRIDDDGKRRPLLVVDRMTNTVRKLTNKGVKEDAIVMVAERIREGKR